MPLPMIHLGVAVKINIPESCKTPEFYLGNISPDAVHMRNGFVHEDKTKSHCNARKLDAIGELDSLCERIALVSDREREFLLGYLVHILTDLYWEDTVLKIFKDRYYSDSTPVQDRRMAYYNDTDQLDFEFYNKEEWRPGVWEMLGQAQCFSVEGAVRKEEVASWQDRTLDWYFGGHSQHTNPVKYISYNELEQFTAYAADKCEKYLKEKGIE